MTRNIVFLVLSLPFFLGCGANPRVEQKKPAPVPYWANATTKTSTSGSSAKSASGGQAECPSQCVGQSNVVYERNQSDKCVAKFAFPCFPYQCSAKAQTCGTSCESNNDCAVGAVCNQVTHFCAPTGSACSDATHIMGTNGQVESCTPYSCSSASGQCNSYCANNSSCDTASGFVCKNSQCVKK